MVKNYIPRKKSKACTVCQRCCISQAWSRLHDHTIKCTAYATVKGEWTRCRGCK
jgi:hypothetical protein